MEEEIKEKYELAKNFYYGEDSEQDYEKAYSLFNELVEENNDENAKFFIAEMYYWGQYVEQDYEKAYNLFSELAKNGDEEAEFYIATMYYYGEYVEKNYKKTYEMCSKLVKKYEHIDAKFFIGKMYYFGYYVEKDDKTALKILTELEKSGYELAIPFITEIKDEIYNDLILEFQFIYRNDFFNLRNFYMELLEQNGVEILNKEKYDVIICEKLTNEIKNKLNMDEEEEIEDESSTFLQCNQTSEEKINHVFNVFDSYYNTDYFINWKLHISNVSKEYLVLFDNRMRIFKQEYTISKKYDKENETIIELRDTDIDKLKINPFFANVDNSQSIDKTNEKIIFKIDEVKSHIMIYLSKMISILSNNNNIDYQDYIAITPYRSSFYDIWKYAVQNDIKYNCKFKITIFDYFDKNSNQTLNQIIDFLQGFNVQCEIETNKFFNSWIKLTIYPRKIEEMQFVWEVMELNKFNYSEWDGDETDIQGTSLWMFSTSIEEKEKICEMLKKTEQDKINRLKELGAPEIIIKHEQEPAICNYGIITVQSLQNKIENILQSLKVKYCILNSNEGELKDGIRNGKGKYTFPDGTYYEGDWIDGSIEGKGKRTYTDGSYYEGEFKDGIRNGKGKYTFPSGTYYEGEWINNKKEGKGKETCTDGSYYEGEWIDNKIEGKGKFIYTDGTYYEGEWINNKKEGKGKETYADGSYYEGNWKNDQIEGKGKFTLIDGTFYECKFANGKLEYYEKNLQDNPMDENKNDKSNVIESDNTNFKPKKYKYIEEEKGVYDSSGVYLSPAELRSMGKENLITKETIAIAIDTEESEEE